MFSFVLYRKPIPRKGGGGNRIIYLILSFIKEHWKLIAGKINVFLNSFSLIASKSLLGVQEIIKKCLKVSIWYNIL